MHIAMVNYEWPGVTKNCGGGGHIGQRLTDSLEDHGHTVTVHTDPADGHHATFPFRTYRRLKHDLDDADPDVIHGHFAVPTSLFLPHIAESLDVPLVVSVMGADVYDPTRYTTIRPVLDFAVQRVLNEADAVAVPSTDMQTRVEEKYGHYPYCIPYGIDPDAWPEKTAQRHEEFRVLTVARLVERKNLETACDAIQIYHDRHGPVKHRIVGTGPKRGRRELIAKDHTEFRGYVDAITDEYRWADAFLLPSHHEAFGIVFLESLASGLPIVTSDTGGQTDIVKNDVGETRPADDPDALADALHTIQQNYPRYQEATDGYVADFYHQQKMADHYLTLYREVAE